jgi:hypothetical protein
VATELVLSSQASSVRGVALLSHHPSLKGWVVHMRRTRVLHLRRLEYAIVPSAGRDWMNESLSTFC